MKQTRFYSSSNCYLRVNFKTQEIPNPRHLPSQTSHILILSHLVESMLSSGVLVGHVCILVSLWLSVASYLMAYGRALKDRYILLLGLSLSSLG